MEASHEYRQFHISRQECQLAERRIPTVEDLINASSSIPDDLSIHVLDKKDAMLRDELFVRGILFPITHVDLQLAFKPIQETKNIVDPLEIGIPCDAIDDVCHDVTTE